MRISNRFLVVSLALSVVSFGVFGYATNASVTADPPAPLAAATAAMPMARGGVAYEAATPLEAVVTPKFDPAKKPSLALTYTVSYKGGNGETVPALLTVPANAGKRVPCIIVQHGLGGRKEDVYLLSAALAKRGYAAFMIDTAGHGARPKISGKPVGELSLNDFRYMVGQTVADLRRGVDFLQTRAEIDPQHIGYLGASLGGIIGGVFIADEPRVECAVLWAAGGNWSKLIAASRHKFAERYRQGPDAVDPQQVGTLMADVDPVNTITAFAPRPLLLINGDKDDIVPTAATDDLFAAARNPKERVVLPGGHVPELGAMIEKTLNWLDSHVKE